MNLNVCTNAVELMKFISTSKLIIKLLQKAKSKRDFLVSFLIRKSKGKKNSKIKWINFEKKFLRLKPSKCNYNVNAGKY